MSRKETKTLLPLLAALVLLCTAQPAIAQVIACEEDTGCPVGSICSQGRCEELICLSVWIPVCGVDGTTYGNRCLARAAHVEVAYEGECPKTCGGVVGVECPKSQFCELPERECDQPEILGVCVDFADPATCPRSWEPICGCNGQTYANDCFRRAAGVSVKHKGECRGAECKSNQGCRKDESCQFRAPSCGAGVTGSCTERPPGPCPDVWAPECGCDGETYGNSCERLKAGVSLLHNGECGESCGGFIGPLCPEGKVCDLVAGSCQQPEAPGQCLAAPEICPEHEDPVCGCDGETYGNDCKRLRAGVTKDYHGPCVDR